MESGHETSILDILEQIKDHELSKYRGENKYNKNEKYIGVRDLTKKDSKNISISDISVKASLLNAKEKGKSQIELSDIKLKRFRNKKQVCILFVVDASRSQGSNKRLAFAKSAVLSILKKAYCDRDKVGLILFGNNRADLILPFTKSVDFAADKMRELKAKGNTPLAMGMRLAQKTIEQDRNKNPENIHIVVLMTDGKSNYDIEQGKPLVLVQKASAEFAEKETAMLVVDTENSVFGMGLSERIADLSKGRYVKIVK